jgi:hypothetical protein
MALQTFSFATDASNGAPGGEYVPATVAQELEQTLSKLTWTILYGKAHDASSLAVSAEQLLSKLRAAH